MDLDEKATVRFETMPGKQGQMDWGFFEDHTVYEDGKWKRLYCFLLVLGYSRMRYIEFVTDMSTNTTHPVSSKRIPVFWRVSGREPVRQYETGGSETTAEAGGQYPKPPV